jgi:SAM-dependent methyltransferase
VSDTLARERKSHIWDRHPDDWYVEEAWIGDRLFATDAFAGCRTMLDPACGTGRLVDAASRAGMRAAGSDISPRWKGIAHSGVYTIADFVTGAWPAVKTSVVYAKPDAIVSNPPFKHAEAFARLSLERARHVVAMILPTTWRCGDARSRWLETTPLAEVLDITPRPSMPPGPVILAGEKPGGGTKDFSVFIWRHGHRGRPLGGWLRKNDMSAKSEVA